MSDNKPMLSRRAALKIIAAAGAGTLLTLPDKWTKPLVQVGALPAHAQVSPVPRSLICPASPAQPTLVTTQTFIQPTTVQVSPAAAGVTVNYIITIVDGFLLAPAVASGSAVTNGAGVAGVTVEIQPLQGTGSFTIAWSLPGQQGGCSTTYNWVLQDF